MTCDMFRTFGRVMKKTMAEYIDKDSELYRYYNHYLEPKMNLRDLELRMRVYDQNVFGKLDNIVHRTYYKNDRQVCKIIYGTKSGSIELMRVENKYRGRGLGKQMLTDSIQDINNNGTNHIYAIAKRNHGFWNNVYKGSFKINEPRSKQLSHNICYFYLDL